MQVAFPRLGLILCAAGSRVPRFALGHLPKQGIDARLQSQDEASDGVGTAHQIAHETFQIVDQTLFVACNRARFGLLQLDAAGDAGHERLRVVGQAFEDTYKIPQCFVDLGRIGFGRAGQRL